jgi:FAD/FMN-containing dehydrogenase
MLTTDTLSDVVAGRIVFPEDEDWDVARGTFNLTLEQRPVAVAFPSDERDVALLVRMARDGGCGSRRRPRATTRRP